MTATAEHSHRHHFAHAANFGRGFAGAIVFGLPLMMTMEMWWLGFTLSGWMLLQFALANLALLVGLSRVSGFDVSRGAIEDIFDALAAFGMGAISSAIVLGLFAEIEPSTPLPEIAGMIVIQAIPASFGAMIADKLFGEDDKPGEHRTRRRSYAGQLTLLVSGALFLSFTMSPTEEIALISFRMTPWHALAMMVLTVAVMHALVYSVGFGAHSEEQGAAGLSVLLRFTMVGYGLAALASTYILWTFGRFDGLSWAAAAQMIVVLSFPAGIGAAIARMVV
ncbi:MAG: TIGR02587 family membrane protein [Pseudomonadota bacterium]|nr:TIGR02587 family membrane protein [Pseudomonadota bacterium]